MLTDRSGAGDCALQPGRRLLQAQAPTISCQQQSRMQPGKKIWSALEFLTRRIGVIHQPALLENVNGMKFMQ